MTLNETMLDYHARAMAMSGLKNPERCSIEFDVYSVDGVPSLYWTIRVTLPNKDRRRNDDEFSGSGDDLDLALADLRERLQTHGVLAG